MSVINKMLQDLDQRQAIGVAGDAAIVRPTAAAPARREWFWRIVAVLLAAALAWVAWVAVHLLPRKPLATDLAFKAAAEARARVPAKPVTAPPPAPAPAAAEEAKPVAVQSNETLRLALELQTPVAEKEVVADKPQPPAPEPARAQPARAQPAKAQPAKPKAAPAPQALASGSVDKRDRTRSAADNAEVHFRRAALLLNHGRVSEAEDQFLAALHADPMHSASRQAYVALLLEQQRTDVARRLLQETLAANPSQATFALALARIHAGQREYAAALEVMERAGSVARNADFQALRGAVLQRLARHGEAVEAYQDATKGGVQPGATWVGLGISLEALGRRSEAAQAYRRALSAGPMAPEAREYAESRARALE